MNIFRVRYWIRKDTPPNIDIDINVIAENALQALTKFISKYSQQLDDNICGELTIQQLEKECIC